MNGSLRDFTLDRLLAVRLSEEDAAAEAADCGDTGARAPARSSLQTEWDAPDLPI